MLKSSIKFNEAFEENIRKIHARVTIGNKSFTEADIFTIDFESGSVNGPGYQIGSVFSDLVKIKFDKVIRGLKELDKVIVEIGIEREQISDSKQPLYNSKVNKMRVGKGNLNKIFYDKQIEYVRLGTFFISEHADINENDQTTSITCMDSVIYFEQVYKPKIKFPASIFDVSIDIANQVGIQINAQSFSVLPDKKIPKPNNLTTRQLIGYISQFACGFIKVSKYGVLELKTPRTTEKIIDSTNYYQKGLSKNDLKYRIDGILNRIQETSKELIAGKTVGSQLILENPFIEQSDLNNIFSLVKDVEYYPFTMQWYGIPSVEAGDWMIVKDNEGNQFRVPNLSYKLHYNGGLKATSSADTQSQSSGVNIFESPLSREITRINKEIVSTKESSITKEEIIQRINISEENIDGEPLRISGNKIKVDNHTEIEDESIKNEAIESVLARKLIGNTDGKVLDIDFLKEEIISNKTEKSNVRIDKGDIKLNNDSDIIQIINMNSVQNSTTADVELISKAISNTDVSSFKLEEREDKLGLLIDSEFNIDELFLNKNGEVSHTQIIMALLVMVKKLNREIIDLKRSDK